MYGDAVSSGDVGLESHGYDMGWEACTAQEVNRPDGLCFFKAFGEEDINILRHTDTVW